MHLLIFPIDAASVGFEVLVFMLIWLLPCCYDLQSFGVDLTGARRDWTWKCRHTHRKAALPWGLCFRGCAPVAWELSVFILYVRMEEVGLLYTAERGDRFKQILVGGLCRGVISGLRKVRRRRLQTILFTHIANIQIHISGRLCCHFPDPDLRIFDTGVPDVAVLV